jgi:hypothetical protein
MNEAKRDLRRQIVSLKAQLHRERSGFDAHWRDLADYFSPRRGRFHQTDRSKSGTKANGRIINNTGIEAAKILSAGMMSGLTSPSRPWFRLISGDPSLNERGDVKQWLYQVEQRMRDVFSKSNIYNTMPTAYNDLGVFGTAAMIVDEDDESVIRATALAVGSYWFGMSHRGVVDTMVREFSMTPKQMAQRFGEENLCMQSRMDLKDVAKAEVYKPVWHMIGPNPDHIDGMIEKTRKRYRSVYLEQTGDDDSVLSVSGYDSWPVLGPRWDVQSDDVYGNSPGMHALGDCRGLQILEDRKLRLVDKMSDPPMVGQAELKTTGSTLLPGDVTYVTGIQGGAGFQPAYVPDPRAVMEVRGEVAEHQRRINAAFFVDLFLMLFNQDRRDMTAREVEERHEEKLLIIGPVLDRLHTEMLDPLIDRTFDIMVKRDMIPPAPDDLQGVEIRPEYISILAQAQRAVAVGGIERLLNYATAVVAATQDPSSIDKLDFDQSFDEFSASIGAPPTMIRSDEAVAELRSGRAQQAQMAQAAEQAKAMQSMAGAAKAASETQVGTGSMLDQLLAPQPQEAA